MSLSFSYGLNPVERWFSIKWNEDSFCSFYILTNGRNFDMALISIHSTAQIKNSKLIVQSYFPNIWALSKAIIFAKI